MAISDDTKFVVKSISALSGLFAAFAVGYYNIAPSMNTNRHPGMALNSPQDGELALKLQLMIRDPSPKR